MNEVGKFLSESGTDYLGTANYDESVELSDYLKKHSDKNTPVLCLGNLTDKSSFNKIVLRNIDVTIADVETAVHLNNFAESNKSINK